MLWLVFIIFSLGLESEGLKDIMVGIPLAVNLMDKVTLSCHYDLEGEELYTVKWYKGKREFYRFIPKELPSMQIFPLPGIDIDLSQSTPNEVVLRNVQPEVTGKYMCEVSSDSPHFDTKSKSGYMYVIDVPAENPVLEVKKDFVDMGDVVIANCTSPPSFPATNISWFLNGLSMTNGSRYKADLLESNPPRKRYVSYSSLRLEVGENTFPDGKAVLSCVSTLFNIYRGEQKAFIEETKPKPRPSSVMGPWEESSGSPGLENYTKLLVVLLTFGFLLCVF